MVVLFDFPRQRDGRTATTDVTEGGERTPLSRSEQRTWEVAMAVVVTAADRGERVRSAT